MCCTGSATIRVVANLSLHARQALSLNGRQRSLVRAMHTVWLRLSVQDGREHLLVVQHLALGAGVALVGANEKASRLFAKREALLAIRRHNLSHFGHSGAQALQLRQRQHLHP